MYIFGVLNSVFNTNKYSHLSPSIRRELFLFAFSAVPRHMEVPGQGSDPSCSCDLSCSCSSAVLGWGSNLQPSAPKTLLFFFFVFFAISWAAPAEVPWLGVESELQPPAYATAMGSEPRLQHIPLLTATPDG